MVTRRIKYCEWGPGFSIFSFWQIANSKRQPHKVLWKGALVKYWEIKIKDMPKQRNILHGKLQLERPILSLPKRKMMKQKNYIPLNLYFCNYCLCQIWSPRFYSQSCKAAVAENDLDYPKQNVASIYSPHYLSNKIRVLKQTRYNLRLEFPLSQLNRFCKNELLAKGLKRFAYWNLRTRVIRVVDLHCSYWITCIYREQTSLTLKLSPKKANIFLAHL